MKFKKEIKIINDQFINGYIFDQNYTNSAKIYSIFRFFDLII